MQVQEILQQLDTLLKNSHLQEEDVFLKEQIAAAEQAKDWQTALTLYNEQIGFFSSLRTVSGIACSWRKSLRMCGKAASETDHCQRNDFAEGCQCTASSWYAGSCSEQLSASETAL